VNDPFRNYDQWLTTDRMAEAAERAAERLEDLWVLAVDAYNLPIDASEDDHEDHEIYVKWLAFIEAVDAREQRLEAEAEAQYYEEQQRAEAAYQAALDAHGRGEHDITTKPQECMICAEQEHEQQVTDDPYYVTDHRDPDAPVKLHEYCALRPGMAVRYIAQPPLEGKLVVDAIYDMHDHITVILNEGEYEVDANNLEPE
jgi:hypothetical protein